MDTSRTLTRTMRPTPRQRVKSALSVVTPLAWVLAGAAVVLVIVGRLLGWQELTVIASTMVVLLVVSIAFTIGRADLVVGIEVKPQRVGAGQRSAASVTVQSAARRRVLPVRMELTVGDGAAEFSVPPLAHGAVHEEVFVLPTRRRAVIPVGPTTSVRSDPLGLMRRTRSWTQVVPLIVHPFTVALGELGTGFVRDLEGQSSNEVSQSDIAFHTLREYQPGDDRRFVHWLTSARVGELMVRQFIDTRRTHVAIVVDGSKASYVDEDEFEMAVSVAASLGTRIILDDQELSMVVSGERIPTPSGTAMLDALSAVEIGGTGSGLGEEVDHLFRVAQGLSLAVLVTGRNTRLADLRAASVRFPPDVRVIGVRAETGAASGFQPVGSQVLVTLGNLADLPRLMRAVAS